MSDLSRVEDLAQRVADGFVEEAEFAELEGLMKEDRESRILYLKTQQIHQDLERKSARGTLGSEATGETIPLNSFGSSGSDRPKSPTHPSVPAKAEGRRDWRRCGDCHHGFARNQRLALWFPSHGHHHPVGQGR